MRFSTFLACTLALLATGGCRERRAAPNVLLVTIDTLRADHCSCYGYRIKTTPRLDGLAEAGVLFETAYAPIPVTGPSHASVLTGQYPRAHEVVRNGYVLDANRSTIAGQLRSRGYDTAAIVSGFPLKRRFGLANGFDHYDDNFTPEEASLPDSQWEGRPLGEPYDRRANAVTNRALSWLDVRRKNRPFFLWVHYFDPHSPYDPPQGFRPASAGHAESSGKRVAAYDGEIRFADFEMGRLLDAIGTRGLEKQTLIIVASDHGEGLGQHGQLEHGLVAYDEALRVPLIFRFPGRIIGGQRVVAPVALLDIAPTVLELVGASADRLDAQGISLAETLLGRGAPEPRRSIFLQNEFDADERLNIIGIRQGAYKYLENHVRDRETRRELYDLTRDPGENRDLSGGPGAVAARLGREVRAWSQSMGPVRRQEIGPQAEAGLRALGYVD